MLPVYDVTVRWTNFDSTWVLQQINAHSYIYKSSELNCRYNAWIFHNFNNNKKKKSSRTIPWVTCLHIPFSSLAVLKKNKKLKQNYYIIPTNILFSENFVLQMMKWLQYTEYIARKSIIFDFCGEIYPKATKTPGHYLSFLGVLIQFFFINTSLNFHWLMVCK